MIEDKSYEFVRTDKLNMKQISILSKEVINKVNIFGFKNKDLLNKLFYTKLNLCKDYYFIQLGSVYFSLEDKDILFKKDFKDNAFFNKVVDNYKDLDKLIKDNNIILTYNYKLNRDLEKVVIMLNGKYKEYCNLRPEELDDKLLEKIIADIDKVFIRLSE